jgi:hypothetical protein
VSRVQIPVYSINRDGFFPDAQVNGDPTNGMYLTENQGYTWLEMDNQGTTPVTIGAVIYHNTVDGITVPEKQMVVGGGSMGVHFGPFPKPFYNQANLDVYFDVDPDGLVGTEGTNILFRAYDQG